MPSIFRKHLKSSDWILLCSSGDREDQDYQDSGSVAAANDQELPILGIGEEQQDTHDFSLLEELYDLVAKPIKMGRDKEV